MNPGTIYAQRCLTAVMDERNRELGPILAIECLETPDNPDIEGEHS